VTEAPSFELTAPYLDLQREARALAAACADVAARADEADRFDPDVRKRLAASGLVDVVVAARYGGRFETVDSLAVTVVREALAYESAHLDSMFAMQGIGSFVVSHHGSDAVRDTWLPKVASLDAIGALALTEPDVGSDLRAITTTAVVDGDEVVVEGHKSFITNAGDADFYSVLCREGDAYSLVLVPASTPGVSVTSPHQIIAPHVLGDVIFQDVRVPIDHRLGEQGNGFKLMLSTLATFRVSVGGAAVGVARAALDEALAHTTSREQFGMPLARLEPSSTARRPPPRATHWPRCTSRRPPRLGRPRWPAGWWTDPSSPWAGSAWSAEARSSGCTARPDRCGSTRARPR
jgi:acyl-CoA dehydrogenase